MTLITAPLGPRQKLAVRIFAAWERVATRRQVMDAYPENEKLVRHAMQTPNLSSLVIRGYLRRDIRQNGTEVYQITPLGRELARRLENAGTNTNAR